MLSFTLDTVIQPRGVSLERASKSENSRDLTVLDGFFYVDSFSDGSCSTTATYEFGFRLQKCIVSYNQNLQPVGSIYGICTSDAYTLSTYDSIDCTGESSNSTFSYLNDCQKGLQIGRSFIALCSSGNDIPISMNSVTVV